MFLKLRWGMLMVLGVSLMGCASSSTIKPDNAPSFMVNQSLEQTRLKAKRVMINFGFNVNELSATYLEGYRPYQIGLITSSGGEKVQVWLESLSEDQTMVSVKTIKQMLGFVGQHRWENDIKEEMLSQ